VKRLPARGGVTHKKAEQDPAPQFIGDLIYFFLQLVKASHFLLMEQVINGGRHIFDFQRTVAHLLVCKARLFFSFRVAI
jgi:hypothetical protein